MTTKMHAASRIYSKSQAADETLQEYIERFTDLVIQAKGADRTAITCQLISVLFITYLFNNNIKKQVAEAKPIQTLRDTMALAQ